MDKDSIRSNNNGNTNTNYNTHRAGGDGLLRTGLETTSRQQTTPDFVLQWGNRKRLRCMKIQVKDESTAPALRTTARVDRRVVRADAEAANLPSAANNTNTSHSNGYFNLRQRSSSPQQPIFQRILRNSENSSAMRGQANGVVRGLAAQDKSAHDRRGTNNNHQNNNHHHHHDNNIKSAASSETAHDSKKGAGGGGGGGTSSGSGEAAAAPPVWPPKFVIALTNKEKEEDFIVFKGSKLPQRPKKRAKFIQRTLNLVSPGAWLCDLTLERYEVREKKISKKRPRGLKAMGNMESDSE